VTEQTESSGAALEIGRRAVGGHFKEREITRGPLGFLLLIARFEEKDADLIAIDPGKLTASVSLSHGRKQQEKFLQVKTFDRAVDS